MPLSNNDDMNKEVSTAEFLETLRRIQEQQEAAKHERHKVNNHLMKTVSEFSLTQLRQKDELAELKGNMDGLKGDVGEIKDDMRQIKSRLIGDEDMRSPGLLDEMSELKAKVATLEGGYADVTFVKRAFAGLSALVGLIGAFVTIYFTLYRK